jgi:hypothetical protein
MGEPKAQHKNHKESGLKQQTQKKETRKEEDPSP